MATFLGRLKAGIDFAPMKLAYFIPDQKDEEECPGEDIRDDKSVPFLQPLRMNVL